MIAVDEKNAKNTCDRYVIGSVYIFPPEHMNKPVLPVKLRSEGSSPSALLREMSGEIRRFAIDREDDLLGIGKEIWELCQSIGFSAMESMQVRTAFSELARNVLVYAKTGEVFAKKTMKPLGIRLLIQDSGPGIENVEQALAYGFSTSNSLGLGLPGAQRLANRFVVVSKPGSGTVVLFEKHVSATAPRRTETVFMSGRKGGSNPVNPFSLNRRRG